MMNIRGIFMSALLMLMSFVSFSQYKAIVGANETSCGTLPLHTYYNYSFSQQIYTQSELAVSSGDILSVSFYYLSSTTTERNIDVYLQTTTLSAFASPYNSVPVAESDLVFSGNISFAENNWTTITFNQPFHYTGGNILLTVDDNTGDYVTTTYSAGFNVSEIQSLSYNSDIENFDPTTSRGTSTHNRFKNYVKFVIDNAEFAPHTTSHWMVDFEEGSFEAYGLTQEYVNGSISWTITETSDTDEHEGEYHALIRNTSSESGDTTILFTQPFVRPDDATRILLSFDYANANNSVYVDKMQVIISDGENNSIIAEYNESHYDWTHEIIGINVSSLPEQFRIGFVGIPAHGYALEIDNISVTNNSAVAIVDSYPWNVDFESGSFDTYGIYQDIISGEKSWVLTESDDSHDGEYNARISNSSTQMMDTSILYTPTFIRPTSEATKIVLSFDMINKIWVNDIDKMQVIVDDGENITVLAEYSDNHEEWTRETISIDIYSLPNRFKFGFVGIPAYGYGMEIDNISVEKSFIDNIVSNSYIQVGTGSGTSQSLPIYPLYNYGYTQQLYTSDELNGSHTIYSVSFYCQSQSEFSRSVKIYMGHTETDEFTEGNQWVPASQLTLVYDGQIEVTSMIDWLLIPLDTPFEYNGTDNLVLAVDDNTGDWISANTNFKCSYPSKNMTLSISSDVTNYEIDNITEWGLVEEYRNNVRFGIQEVEIFNIEVSSSDTLRGTACCSGEYYAGYGYTISAEPKFGFVFDRWSDGVRENPRYIEVEGNAEYIANFIPNISDTISYDNDNYSTPIGNHGNAVEWGIRILPQHLKDRPKLTDVLFYSDGQHACGNYKLNVYQGTDTIPEQPIYRDSVVVATSDDGHWVGFEMPAVAIDSTLPLWIILSTEDVAYPAVASDYLTSGDDGRWWNGNGTWAHQNYGAWMIKAVLPYEGTEDVEEYFENNNIEVYPNPASSQIYLTGISEGENVEIYNITGSLVANFNYNGDAVDIASYAPGLYVIRSKGQCVKFVKE